MELRAGYVKSRSSGTKAKYLHQAKEHPLLLAGSVYNSTLSETPVEVSSDRCPLEVIDDAGLVAVRPFSIHKVEKSVNNLETRDDHAVPVIVRARRWWV